MKVYRSQRHNKKYKVVVDGREVHFGASGYRVKPGTKAGDSYCARSSGIGGLSDRSKSNYWARRLWGCVGKKSVKENSLLYKKNKF